MAVIDTNKMSKPYVKDRDNNVNIGIDMPFRTSESGEGWGASTKQTMDAVANNLKNLVSTEMGERVYQPNLGVALRKFLFEPFSEDVIDGATTAIYEAVSYWLPFVNIDNIDIKMSENNTGDFKSVMNVKIVFSLKKDPNTHESIQVTIGGGGY
jgi:phage baseplate assembly protein W